MKWFGFLTGACVAVLLTDFAARFAIQYFRLESPWHNTATGLNRLGYVFAIAMFGLAAAVGMARHRR